MPLISGSVFLMGEEVGAVSGEYIDESQDAPSENIQSRSIPGDVLLEGEVVSIAVNLAYDDYVSYNGGGIRTVDISGTVYLTYDGGNYIIVGNASGSLEDNYGAAGVVETQLSLEVTPHIDGTLKYTLKAKLTDADGNPLQGKLISFYHYTDPSVKELIGQAETDENGEAQIEYETSQTEYVIAYFAGDETYEASWSNEVELHPEQYIVEETTRRMMIDVITPVMMIIIAILAMVLIIKVLGKAFKE